MIINKIIFDGNEIEEIDGPNLAIELLPHLITYSGEFNRSEVIRKLCSISSNWQPTFILPLTNALVKLCSSFEDCSFLLKKLESFANWTTSTYSSELSAARVASHLALEDLPALFCHTTGIMKKSDEEKLISVVIETLIRSIDRIRRSSLQ
jgi:hypothetical protein